MFAFYARKTFKKNWHYISAFYWLCCVLLYLQTGVPQMLCSKVCWHVCIISRIRDNWAATWDFRATSKGSNQPAHTRNLIRAFVSRLTILWLRYWPKLELSRLIWVCTCQNTTLLEEIARRSSYVVVNFGLSLWPEHRMSENLLYVPSQQLWSLRDGQFT